VLEKASYSWPRIIRQPLRRSKHVMLDLCTPEGKIVRETIPKSRGKMVYKDAKSSFWGNLWPHANNSRSEDEGGRRSIVRDSYLDDTSRVHIRKMQTEQIAAAEQARKEQEQAEEEDDEDYEGDDEDEDEDEENVIVQDKRNHPK